MKKIIMYRLTKSIVIPLGMTVLFSYSNDMKDLQQPGVQKKFPQEEAYNFKLVRTDSLKVVAVPTSPLNKDFSNQQMSYSKFPEGVKVEFYDQARYKNIMQARYGVIYPSIDIVELRDSVVLATYNDKKFDTTQLLWDQKEDWASTDRKFTFTDIKKGTAIKGIGMDFDKEPSTVEAHKTTGILSIEDKDEQDMNIRIFFEYAYLAIVFYCAYEACQLWNATRGKPYTYIIFTIAAVTTFWLRKQTRLRQTRKQLIL